MNNQVAVVRPGALTNPQTYIADYQEVIARATAQATVLMKIVEERKLYTTQRGGRRFLHFEAWQLVGAFDNSSAAVEHTLPIEEHGITIGYTAKVNVLKDGQVISSAEAVCFLDESVAAGRNTESGKKQAAMSMAQTRAASKALRMKYSAVAVLAGFQPTPAEEMMPEDDDAPAKRTSQQPAPQSSLVTEAQLRKVFGDAHRAGWTDDALKEHCENTYGVTSSKDLTKVQASELIEYIAAGSRPAATPAAPEQAVMV